MSAQNPPQGPEFRIEIDVAGKAIDDTKAAEKKKKTEWIELRSRNFLVVGDADLDDLRQAASEAELFRSQFAVLFPRASGPSSVPTRIVVFRNNSSIGQFGPLNEDGFRQTKPYLQASPDTNYLVLTAGDQLSHDIIREYVRLLTRDSISPVPLWFQEGVSEYFSTYELDRLGKDRVIKMGLDVYKQKLKEKELIPLSMLFTLSRDDYDAMDSDTKKFFSAESCALFDYLLVTRHLTASLRMINGMAEGKPIAQNFRDSFKMNLLTFEENFRRQIQYSKLRGWQVSFTGLSIDPNKRVLRIFYAKDSVKMVPVSFDSVRAEVEVKPVRLLTEAQAQAYRGDLLLHNDRLEEAESHLLNAVELDDKLATPLASLAAAKSAQHDYAAAQDYIDKALRLDPGNYLAYYYDAELIREEAKEAGADLTNEELEEIRAALSRSVQISPEFVETSELLAETQRMLRGDLNSSTRLLVDGLKHSLGRESLLMAIARVSADAGQKPTAGWLLQHILFSGSADKVLKQEAKDFYDRLNLTPDEKSGIGIFTVNDSASDASHGFSARVASKDDRKALAKSEDKGTFVRGIMTQVDCSKGITIYIRIGTRGVDQRIENLHTDAPDRIDWVSDDGQPVHAVTCDTFQNQVPVAITYKPGRKGLMMGEPLVVEFLRLPINVEALGQ